MVYGALVKFAIPGVVIEWKATRYTLIMLTIFSMFLTITSKCIRSGNVSKVAYAHRIYGVDHHRS